MRAAVKKWLKIKTQCPNVFLYADIKDGGLGIPALRYKKILQLCHQKICDIRVQTTPCQKSYSVSELATPVVAGKRVATKDDY